MYTAEGHTVPWGFCIRFHSRGQICERGAECPYIHRCPNCSRRHPIFERCYTHRQRLYHSSNKSTLDSSYTKHTKESKKEWKPSQASNPSSSWCMVSVFEWLWCTIKTFPWRWLHLWVDLGDNTVAFDSPPKNLTVNLAKTRQIWGIW